ncbi:Na(+)/H(+) antiporter subunit B [Edaphobacillus lindanitolerans]|uniref:Multisubunit sodium/proton antiporter, MrpB subunit n=1 Tax=Edaphobacillus lindanitolerans TaxID=550447 RepID=A0A1U7PRW9_9BACI|nr:Na(+)/H(+) antiporter subunit B [Edaphobacillus lindanitolerans]SIT89299.1 multisubunit sodium/proton antiporter, MrpB subunit [Edaphobacillus lindanitolerans]
MKGNDVILRTVSRIVVFIILTFGVELFLSGHNNPGGGFIGGLVLSSALVLLYVVFDIETVHQGVPLDFKKVAAFGAMLAVLSGTAAAVLGHPFLSQGFGYFDLPIFGVTELTTVTIFEAGVALTVIGTVETIILSISKDV